MSLIVQKFGGTSVANIERIENVAKLVAAEFNQGNQVIVVVSAMSGVTDQLANYVSAISDLSNESQLAEYSAAISSGEQVTAGILALKLQFMGVEARSWQGWQLGIVTDNNFVDASIQSINTKALEEGLARREVAVVAGFQGVAQNGRITTLGRGGSDTSAAFIAAAVNADRCDIYTDVDGVYTADPNVVPEAKKIPQLSYEEMLELSTAGAKILHKKAAEIALQHKVNLRILSSFTHGSGTIVMERSEYRGVNITSTDSCLVTINNISGLEGKMQACLERNKMPAEMFETAENHISFVIEKSNSAKLKYCLKEVAEVDLHRVQIEEKFVKVSLIFLGIKKDTGESQAKAKAMLLVNNIKVYGELATEARISFLVEKSHAMLAARLLHSMPTS